MKNKKKLRPKIWNLLDSRMTELIPQDPIASPPEGVFLVSDKEWDQMVYSLSPVNQNLIKTIGFSMTDYKGKYYQCLQYKTFPVIKRSDLK